MYLKKVKVQLNYRKPGVILIFGAHVTSVFNYYYYSYSYCTIIKDIFYYKKKEKKKTF